MEPLLTCPGKTWKCCFVDYMLLPEAEVRRLEELDEMKTERESGRSKWTKVMVFDRGCAIHEILGPQRR